MRRSSEILKFWLLLTVVAVSGCNVWIFPDEEGGDQSAAVVEVDDRSGQDEQGSSQTAEKPAAGIPEFDDGKLRVLLWRETDNDRTPRWQTMLLLGERWDQWCAANQVEFRAWDKDRESPPNEKPGWKRVLKTMRPGSVPWLHVFRGSKVVIDGPLKFQSTTPEKQVEDLIRLIESAGK